MNIALIWINESTNPKKAPEAQLAFLTPVAKESTPNLDTNLTPEVQTINMIVS